MTGIATKHVPESRAHGEKGGDGRRFFPTDGTFRRSMAVRGVVWRFLCRDSPPLHFRLGG